jgi:hypothetical protein
MYDTSYVYDFAQQSWKTSQYFMDPAIVYVIIHFCGSESIHIFLLLVYICIVIGGPIIRGRLGSHYLG